PAVAYAHRGHNNTDRAPADSPSSCMLGAAAHNEERSGRLLSGELSLRAAPQATAPEGDRAEGAPQTVDASRRLRPHLSPARGTKSKPALCVFAPALHHTPAQRHFHPWWCSCGTWRFIHVMRGCPCPPDLSRQPKTVPISVWPCDVGKVCDDEKPRS